MLRVLVEGEWQLALHLDETSPFLLQKILFNISDSLQSGMTEGKKGSKGHSSMA